MRTAEQVVGPLAQVKPIGVQASAPGVQQRFEAAIDSMEEGQGVLVLTDLFGGSPTNFCLACLSPSRHVEVITGVNLPMLLKLSSLRKDGVALEALAQSLASAAQQSIFLVSQRLREKLG